MMPKNPRAWKDFGVAFSTITKLEGKKERRKSGLLLRSYVIPCQACLSHSLELS